MTTLSTLFKQHSVRGSMLTMACAALTACAGLGPDAQNLKPIEHVALAPTPAGIAQTVDAWPENEWWLAYADAQLNRLMQRALANNPTLATAQARIAQAQAASDFNRAAERPQLAVGADISYGRQSENYLVPPPPIGPGGEYVSQGQAALSFGYELDLWGKNAALIRSAEAQVKAATYEREAARLALTTSVARAYAQLAAQYELQDILLATERQRQEIRRLVEQRVASGLDTRVEAKQAETNEAALRIELEQLATALKVTRLQLASLVGDMPENAAAIERPALAATPFTVPATLPLDLLGRRPELAAQRARIAAALGETEAAKAQFYPNVNLNALIGYQAIGIGNLFKAGSQMSSIGPAIRLPIFDGGRLRANYAMKSSGIDIAVAQYNQSVLAAAQDVSEQLTRLADLAREEAATREALAAAEEAHRLATLRYKGGLSTYLTVLTVETQLLTQRRALSNLTARKEDLHIALVRALGGGFTESGSAQALASRH